MIVGCQGDGDRVDGKGRAKVGDSGKLFVALCMADMLVTMHLLEIRASYLSFNTNVIHRFRAIEVLELPKICSPTRKFVYAL
jgi:hypothetical protein